MNRRIVVGGKTAASFIEELPKCVGDDFVAPVNTNIASRPEMNGLAGFYFYGDVRSLRLHGNTPEQKAASGLTGCKGNPAPLH